MKSRGERVQVLSCSLSFLQNFLSLKVLTSILVKIFVLSLTPNEAIPELPTMRIRVIPPIASDFSEVLSS